MILFIFYFFKSINFHPPCSFICPRCSPPLGSARSTFISISFNFLFPKLATISPADFLSRFLFVFVHHPHPSPKAPQASCEAVGSIHLGGLFFIVIHPRDCALLVFPLYAQSELSLWKTNASLEMNNRCELIVEKQKEKALCLAYIEMALPFEEVLLNQCLATFSLCTLPRALINMTDGETLYFSFLSLSRYTNHLTWFERIVDSYTLPANTAERRKKNVLPSFLSLLSLSLSHTQIWRGLPARPAGAAWENSQKHLQKISVSNAGQ